MVFQLVKTKQHTAMWIHLQKRQVNQKDIKTDIYICQGIICIESLKQKNITVKKVSVV